MKNLGVAVTSILLVLGLMKLGSGSTDLASTNKVEVNEIAILPKAEATNPVEKPQNNPVEKPVEIRKLPEHFRKQGYEIDPENPAQAIKKFTRNGKEALSIVELDSFEPRDATSADALLLLKRKIHENPELEVQAMHPVDFKSNEGSMLLGKFHDPKQKVELTIRLRAEDNAEKVCLSLPGELYKSEPGSYPLRVDSTGYGIVSLGQGKYLRMMWAFDPNRIVHGQLIRFSDNEVTILKTFSVNELSQKVVKELNHCD